MDISIFVVNKYGTRKKKKKQILRTNQQLVYEPVYHITLTAILQDDPFSNVDPFGGSNFSSSPAPSGKKMGDSFDPFGGGSTTTSKSPAVSSEL